MLEPGDRRVLLEALRPPEGYVVDRAVATTYTLDLVALLMAPLAFSLYDQLAVRDSEGGAAGPSQVDSFALLHAVREHGERLTVFCESGCIAKPPRYRQLMTYVESSIVQVRAASDQGCFHPKVWLLRFQEKGGEGVRYRLLCNSRNLTFDKSWDTMLVLDGELTDRTRAFAENHPLGDFVAALPNLAIRKVSASVGTNVSIMADEVRRVKFELPEGFDAIRFWPLGHDGKHPWPFTTRVERLLVVSPFLTSSALARLTDEGTNHVLVSRLPELETIPAKVLAAFSGVNVLNDAAATTGAEDEAHHEGEEEPTVDASNGLPPSTGLHAKLYVADDGRDAHIWTGSANATHAAFEQNVEFLVQLTGKKKMWGVTAMLDGAESRSGLGVLLGPFTPLGNPVEPTPDKRRVEEKLRAARAMIGRTPWVCTVKDSREGEGKADLFKMTLSAHGDGLQLPDGVEVRCWPISLSDSYASDVRSGLPGRVAEFTCSFQALTPFVAFQLKATAGAEVEEAAFVVTAVLEGAPADRSGRVLQSLLEDPARVMRFLRLLLAVDPHDALTEVLDADDKGVDGASGRFSTPAEEAPLLESLVRALDREPSRLVGVERLVRELRSTPEGARMLPPNFDLVWAPLWAAYESLPAARRGGA